MQLIRQVPIITLTAILIFAAAALLLAPVSGGNIDRVVVRLVIEFPLLLLVAGIGLIVLNLMAAGTASLFGGSTLVAAAIATLLAWAIAGGSSSFGGLGYHVALRPAYAIAIALPWLFRSNLGSLIRDWRK